MEERSLSRSHFYRACRLTIGMWACLFALTFSAWGEEFRNGCDSSKTSWIPAYDRVKVRVDKHERNGYEYHSGTAAEALQLTSEGDTYLRLSHRVPKSRVIDELQVSLWMRSNRGGAILAMRVTLPFQIDPRTEKPVEFDVRGAVYSDVHRWQELSTKTEDLLVERQLKLLRSRLAKTLDAPLNLDGMHVAEVVLVVPGDKGTTELLVDDLRYGPIVRLDERATTVQTASAESYDQRPECPVRIDTNRLLVEGKPFFPRIVPYHGENLEVLSRLGVNVAWVAQYDDHILTEQLADRGIWSMAAPPQAKITNNSVQQVSAGLMPIPPSTSSILFWTVGTRIPANQLKTVELWTEQIRDADRAFDRPRPVLGDVIGEERRFSRYVSLLGTSRHIINTTVSPLAYRDYLDHKQRLALPDRLKWTWIGTEPAAGNVTPRSASRHRPVMMEAEQIWLQAWTAISVGHKAIGYWKKDIPLDAESTAANERRLALAILNSQIDLLEPWLATGKVVDTVPVSVSHRQQPDLGRSGYSFRNAATSRNERDALLAERDRGRARANRADNEIRAAVIQSEYGWLVIPTWFEDGAQFQPGQMAAQDVSLLVRGAGDHARAWQVTSTSVTPIEPQRLAGGMQIELPMLDRHAFIVMTADPALEQKLMQRMKTQRQQCGRLWVQLAQDRLKRVRSTHADIEDTPAPKVPDAPFMLASATKMVDQADAQLQAEQFADAERFSRYALQLLRKLQRAHWDNAVTDLTAPTSSPHTVCFETLPDHWRMIATIGRSAEGHDENLIRSGNFEDLGTMAVDGWEQVQLPAVKGVVRTAELHEDAASGLFCLRLRSLSDRSTSSVERTGPEVIVTSPKVPVRGGQIVLVSGKLRIDQIDPQSIDGLMIYDNIMGTVGAIRFTKRSRSGEWQTFQILREVPATSDVQLTFELHGEGDVRIDDVQMMTLSPSGEPGQRRLEARTASDRRTLLDFAPPFPKVKLWPGRKKAESDERPSQIAP